MSQCTSSTYLCFSCKQPGHMSYTCPKPCFNCKESGHRFSDCPKPRGFAVDCFQCGQIGHFAYTCPRKKCYVGRVIGIVFMSLTLILPPEMRQLWPPAKCMLCSPRSTPSSYFKRIVSNTILQVIVLGVVRRTTPEGTCSVQHIQVLVS